MREETPILHPFLPITFSQCSNKSAIIENAFLYDTHTQKELSGLLLYVVIYCVGEQGGDPAAHLPGSLPPRKRDPVRPGAPIRQDCRHAPRTQVPCRHGSSCASSTGM
jgi:hypothetical protein